MAYDYSGMMAKLNLAPLTEALRSREVFKQQSADRAQEQRKLDYTMSQDQAKIAYKNQYAADYQDAIMAPSAAKFTALQAKYPDFHEATQTGWKSYSDNQQRDMVGTAGSLVAALSNGRPDLALHALNKRRDALKNSEIDTTETDALIKMVDSGDPVQLKAARGISAMVLAQASGDKFDTVWQRLNSVDNAEELQGDRARSAAADADYKESRARLEPARVQATIGRANATASDARSRQARRDRSPGRLERPTGPPNSGNAAPRRQTKRTPTATGPDGRKYVVKGGQWVPAS